MEKPKGTKAKKRVRARASSKGAAPKVALDRAAKARRRIEAGIRALERVRTADGARRAIERRWPTSVNAFIDWKSIGSDTLYRTNPDLLDGVRDETDRLAELAKTGPQKTKRPKRTSNLTQVKKQLAESKALLAARDLDVLRMSEEIEKERRDKLHYMRLLEEAMGR